MIEWGESAAAKAGPVPAAAVLRRGVDQQSRKPYGRNHGRPENKGLRAAKGRFFVLTAFIKFRGPQALKDKLEWE